MTSGMEEDFIERIYDVIVDPAKLDSVVGALQEQVEARFNLMFVNGGSGGDLWCVRGIDPVAIRKYATHYSHLDVLGQAVQAAGLHRSGTVASTEMLVPPEALRRSPLIQELYAPNGIGSQLGCSAFVPGSGPFVQLSFYRTFGQEPFGRRELRLLQRLAPHFSRMARLRLRMDSRTAVEPWAADLVDGLPWGVVLLDAARRSLLVNREATRILAAADGLVLGRSELRATHGEDGRSLERLMSLATAGSPAGRRGGDVAITRPSGERPWLVTVVPIGSREPLRVGEAEPRAAVHIIDPMNRLSAPGERLRAMFGLSPAEQRLAVDLVHNLTLAEAAEHHGSALSTVRTQLLRLFAKTGTSRQSELVALLGRCLALPDSPDDDNPRAPL